MSETAPRRRLVLAGGLWFAASQTLPLLSTAALSIVLGKILGPNALGQLALIAYTESTLSCVLVWGLTFASIQSIAAHGGRGDPTGASRMSWWSFRAHLLAGTAAAGVLITIGMVRADNTIAWSLAGLTALVNAWAWAYGSQIAATSGWTAIGRRRLTTQLFATIFGTVAILLGGGIAWVFVGNILGAAWLALALRSLLPRYDAIAMLRPAAGFIRLWVLLAAIQVITQLIAGRSEYFVLDAYWPDSEIAMYSIAFMLVAAAAAASAAITGAVMPIIAAAHESGEHLVIREHLSRALRLVAVLSIAVAAMLVALGPGLVLLLYGSEFEQAAPLVRLAALGILVLPIAALCNDYWSGRGQLKGILIAGSTAGVLNIVAALVLIPPTGALGAVIANLIGEIALCLIAGWITWRTLGRFSWSWGRWLVMIVVSTVAAAAGGWTANVIGGISGLAVAASLTLFLLVAGMFLGRVLGADDARWLTEILPQSLRRPVELIGHVRHAEDA